MRATFRSLLSLLHFLVHRLAFATILLMALGLLCATLGAATGMLPWVELDLSFGEQPVENAGMIAQISVTVLALMLASFLPSNRRLMALENSHRDFNLGMNDVAQAYHHAHAADRTGLFQLSSEFDSIRERLTYLRDHPDLGALEPDILELAAQMSHVSRELADVYSDDAITRARDFLRQRQQEVERFNARLDQAKSISTELKHWMYEIELEESVAASQLERLRDELHEVLPEMGRETRARAGTAPDTIRDTLFDLPRAAE